MGRGQRRRGALAQPQPEPYRLDPETTGALARAVERRLAEVAAARDEDRHYPPLPAAEALKQELADELALALARVGRADLDAAPALIRARFAEAGIAVTALELVDDRYHAEDRATVYATVSFDDLGRAQRLARGLDQELDGEALAGVVVRHDLDPDAYLARISAAREAAKHAFRGYLISGQRRYQPAAADELADEHHFHLVRGFVDEEQARAWAAGDGRPEQYVTLHDVVTAEGLPLQVQYLSRYLTQDGLAVDLSVGLRVDLSGYANGGNYHAVRIHQDDAAEFARRVKAQRARGR